MRIFYGVQGTGNGHITRARAMARHLQERQIEVQFLFSGRPRDEYFDMQPFGDWWCRRGLTFVTERGRLRPLKTLLENNLWRFWRDIANLDLSAYDLVLTDFEPVTAWACRRQGIPCIGLGHQYAFDFDVPVEGDLWGPRTIMKMFAPATQRMGLHWHHFEQPILPPIIDTRESALPIHNNQVLVYLGFEAAEEVIPLLQRFPQQQFVYYGKFDTATEERNVSLRPLSVAGFKHDLARSRGVICNAGFELASEALQLGKQLLVKPLHGQMEQLSNALALETLHLGQRMERLSGERIGQWLAEAPQPDCHYPDVAEAIVEWLLQPRRCSIPELSQQLWQQARVGCREEADGQSGNGRVSDCAAGG